MVHRVPSSSDSELDEQVAARNLDDIRRTIEMQNREDIPPEGHQPAGGDAIDPDAEVEERLAGLADSRIDSVRTAQQFIQIIQTATIPDDKLDEDAKALLLDPPKRPPKLDNPDQLHSLELYLACCPYPEAAYNDVREATLRRHPDDPIQSLHEMRQYLIELTGVVPVKDDMCGESCHAFTGPWCDRATCTICLAERFFPGTTKPVKEMVTLPLGPQIQALRRSREGSEAMRYRANKLRELMESMENDNTINVYDDIFCGEDILNLAVEEGMTENDTTFGFSVDGARLYQDKKSDTWIGIWIIYDYDPTVWYKHRHILPALVVPGPNHPKVLLSFLFRSFYHVSALMRHNGGQGIPVWDALRGAIVSSKLFWLFGLADALGLVAMDGRVGHQGARGCRLGCMMQGRHKPGQGVYYAVHLRPNEDVPDSTHPNFDFASLGRPAEDNDNNNDPIIERYNTDITAVIESASQAEYEERRKQTGLAYPSIFLGLPQNRILGVPRCFTADLMHLLYLNVSQLLIPMWRGTMKCEETDSKDDWPWLVLTGDAWVKHGALVAEATHYFPSSFHRPPQNPQLKINSGFKATEYYLYVMGLGPGFFRPLLPAVYWANFCKLVHAVHIILQRRITVDQLREAHAYFIGFVKEYEHLYYRRRIDRLHFCRPCLHTLLHLAEEVFRVGPGACTTQFAMEDTIGDLGEEIRQPSTLFSNLAQIATRRAQLNAIKTLYPSIIREEKKARLPSTAEELGEGYVLLRPRSKRGKHWNAIDDRVKHALVGKLGLHRVTLYGRLVLPNGQISRSLYSESNATKQYQRVTRNVKVHLCILCSYSSDIAQLFLD